MSLPIEIAARDAGHNLRRAEAIAKQAPPEYVDRSIAGTLVTVTSALHKMVSHPVPSQAIYPVGELAVKKPQDITVFLSTRYDKSTEEKLIAMDSVEIPPDVDVESHNEDIDRLLMQYRQHEKTIIEKGKSWLG